METLDELRRSFALYAVCPPCGRMQRLDIERLVAYFGPQTRIDQVRKRLRCHECGRRSQNIRIVFTGQCNRAAEFHYRKDAGKSAGKSAGKEAGNGTGKGNRRGR